MDWLLLLMQLLRALVIVAIGYKLCRMQIPIIRALAPLDGRYNRVQFAILIVVAYIVMHLFYDAVFSALEAVIVLPAYWFLRTLLFLGGIFVTPFYLSIFGRRLQDMAIPGYIAIPWTIFLVFAPTYGVVKSTSFIFSSIIVLVTIFMTIAPGTPNANAYGPPSRKKNTDTAKKPRKQTLLRRKKNRE